ncbi:MAG: glutamate synthase subunit beta [Myxococcota bacterium]
MGKAIGFLEYGRQAIEYESPRIRLRNYREFSIDLSAESLREQGARCMDCGVPFCQSATGCPIDNLIPEWNDLVYRGRDLEALERLHKTNNFPEFTGRVCPAPCEGACVLGINQPPVAIKSIESSIVDRGFAEGWIVATPPKIETERSVGVVGSGPAGLAAAQQLRRAGHRVTVYERHDRVGGLLTYGIPNMKLEKADVERRVQQLRDEGIRFETQVEIGKNLEFSSLRKKHDALLLACGATRPRNLELPGRELAGVHFAMDFLHSHTKSLLDSKLEDGSYLSAKDRKVVVIGGGDTGTDCIATAMRHGCASVTNFEILERPPEHRADHNPWPEWPMIFRVEYGHEEAAAAFGTDPRSFGLMSKRFLDNGKGQVVGIETVQVQWSKNESGHLELRERPGTEQRWNADMVLLAMGFLGPEPLGADTTDLSLDDRGNIAAGYGEYETSLEGVFAAGDCRRGPSLVVWAIGEGRGAARAIDAYLMGESSLPEPD